MKAARRWGAFLVLAVVPLLPRMTDLEPAWAVEPLLLVLVALLVPRKWAERKVASGVFAVAWMAILLFELGMSGGRFTMNEDPVLYDGVQLLWHLGVLLADLYGQAALVAAMLAFVAAALLCGALAEVAFRQLMGEERRDVGAGWVLGVAGLAAFSTPFSAGALFNDRFVQSVELYDRVATLARSDAHVPFVDLEVDTRPDVRVYVLESYGMTTYRSAFAKDWPARVDKQRERLDEKGWATAAIRSIAPTHGGRSWICDAAFLSGRQIRYQAEYAALTRDASGLHHLPGWFDDHGWETVLARPSDRARPGVQLQNRFAFDETVFYHDLGYAGRPVGWGRIPDQYTIGWLHENAFDSEQPQFSFAHLATAHYPWKKQPPYADDWHSWNTEDDLLRERKARSLDTELWWVSRTFRRGGEFIERTVSERAQQVYLGSVEHGLKAVVDELVRHPPRRPTLVFILGDHQPPFLGERGRYDVPVHIAASDPKLLEEFLDAGAERGWTPGKAAVQHASFYSRIIRAIGRFDGVVDLPPVLPQGVE